MTATSGQFVLHGGALPADELPTNFRAGIVAAATIALCVALHHLVEAPLMNLGHRFAAPQLRKA